MWKLIIVARRGWRMVPSQHKRKVLIAAAIAARDHGPKAVQLARRVGAKRKPPPG
jgi:hypothetical protein